MYNLFTVAAAQCGVSCRHYHARLFKVDFLKIESIHKN